MNRIGRRKTVLLSLLVTFLSLLLPIFGDGYLLMLISFSLLGIGNALMQTSLNPLLSNIISGDKLASSLTFGQFVKAIASFLAPYIAMWGATQTIPSLGLGWRVLFPVYMIIAVIAVLWLGATRIEEEQPDKASGFVACFKLLGKPFVLLCFLGIMCHVGIDVGTNTTAPKILMERMEMTLDMASFATSLYFIFRTIGCFSGAIILRHVSAKSFFAVSVGLMLLLAGTVGSARKEERNLRIDDYGTLRWYHFPTVDGLYERRHGPKRRYRRDDGRCPLSAVLYGKDQTIVHI